MKLQTFLTLVLLLSLTACEKKESTVVTNEFFIYLNYKFKKDVTCKFYTSKEDYNNDYNVYKTVILHKDSTTKKLKGFVQEKTYYYDCYSDDMTITNWANGYATSLYTYPDNQESFYINCDTNTWHRRMLQPNGAKSSTWVITNTWDRSRGQIINEPLTEAEKAQKLVINRNGTGEYYQLNDKNEIYKKDIFVKTAPNISDKGGIYFILTLHESAEKNNSFSSIYGPFSINEPHLKNTSRTDTLFMVSSRRGFLFTRQ